MNQATLHAALLDGVSDAPARRVVLGVNWVLVEGPAGTGLAHAPPRGAPGCRPLAQAGRLAGTPLSTLAAGVGSDNPFEVAVAIAAANAHHNRPDLAGEAGNAIEAAGRESGRVVVVGRFPGLERSLPHAAVIERSPGPGDHPESDAPELIGAADLVLVTASTLGNGSLAGILDLARCTRVVLVGPGTPLAPALFACGIERLAGMVVDDPETAARVVMEGGAVRQLRPAGRNLTIARPGAAAPPPGRPAG
ncbi:Rossmann-like domain-containing protein [Stella sp.]|uniref:Rossmann-like domain-containing protein n=1 Tax=Stella sp. TaxID=2912054 RepID=UPI0035AF0725